MKNSPLLIAVASLAFAAAASGQVLMLDFGPTTAAGTDRLNSPYHTVNGSFTETTWNTLGVADVGSGLVLSDGAPSGVSVDLGISTTTTINLAAQPGTSNALGTASNTDIYAETSVGTDGIFSGNGTSNNTVGVQIGGLAIGTYDVYVTARNTNTGQQANNGYTQTVFAGVAAASGNFNYSGYGSASIVYASNQPPASYRNGSWVEGDNYVKLSVSITATGQFLNLAVDGTNSGGSGDTRGFINSIQIVTTSSPIPESSAFAALAGFASLGFVAMRRRRT